MGAEVIQLELGLLECLRDDGFPVVRVKRGKSAQPRDVFVPIKGDLGKINFE